MEMFPCLTLKAALLFCLVALGSAGIIMQSDQSQVCATNLRNCQQSCSPPPNFVFSCNSGGVFSAPTQQCDCVVTASGTSVDGVGTLQAFQYSGPQACAGNRWIMDCGKSLSVQIMGSGLAAMGGSGVAGGLSMAGLSPVSANCGQQVQGIVTGADSAVIKFPTFDILGQVKTRGNDTVEIYFGGQGSQCTAGYKLTQGTFLGLGQAPTAVAEGDATAVAGAAGAGGLGAGMMAAGDVSPSPAPSGEVWSKKSGASVAAAAGSLLLAAPAAALLLAAL